ncbi:MAG: RecA protein [Bacillota bacterium]|nr:RecA protein [Bacillota bacterium]
MDKNKALEQALAQIEKQFGRGSIMKLGENAKLNIEAIPTGALNLEGISKEGCIVDMGVEAEIINKSGSWYSYEGNRIGQGRENLKEYLTSNPVLLNEIELKIRVKFKSGEIEQVHE